VVRSALILLIATALACSTAWPQEENPRDAPVVDPAINPKPFDPRYELREYFRAHLSEGMVGGGTDLQSGHVSCASARPQAMARKSELGDLEFMPRPRPSDLERLECVCLTGILPATPMARSDLPAVSPRSPAALLTTTIQ
jgi:hypothetical protein